MNLSNMNSAELRSLLDVVTKEIAIREKSERDAAIEEIYSIAHRMGISLQSLIEKKATLRKPFKAATRYADPDNPENVWGGRGPRPPWLKNALASGKKLDQFISK